MAHTTIDVKEYRAIAKMPGTANVPAIATRLGRNKTSLYDEV